MRTRLVAALVVLLAIVSMSIGIATELALRNYLMIQLDRQVIDSGRRAATIFELGPPPPLPPGFKPLPPFDFSTGPGPAFLRSPGQSAETVGALVTGGRVTEAGVITTAGSVEQLNAVAASNMADLPVDKQPITITLEGIGRYRVIVMETTGGQTVVSGLPMADLEATLLSVLIMLSVIAAIALAAATAAGILLIRRQLAPLTKVSAAARAVSDLELDRGEVHLPVSIAAVGAGTDTEVGQLGAALNRMLEHIAAAMAARHDSETRVRKFVADASHELRTPLAAIRGYTELVQRRRDELPGDVAYAMSRVESETKRMTQLVSDMLLLARLDEGRPLDNEPVDLTRLTVDAVSDAHAAGPEHQWSLDLPDEPVLVTGDEAGLHQVLANLLANCRTHTPPGTAVTTSLVDDGTGGALLAIGDNGPGIPAYLQPDIFDRFTRGDSSRSRQAGSTGLGLAIVAAIIKAHNGTIHVRSRPGDTEFTVRLPATDRKVSRTCDTPELANADLN